MTIIVILLCVIIVLSALLFFCYKKLKHIEFLYKTVTRWNEYLNKQIENLKIQHEITRTNIRRNRAFRK